MSLAERIVKGASAKAVHPFTPLNMAYGKQLQSYMFFSPPQNRWSDVAQVELASLAEVPQSISVSVTQRAAAGVADGHCTVITGILEPDSVWEVCSGLGDARAWACQAAWNNRAFLWFVPLSKVGNCISPQIQLHSLSVKRLATCLCLLNKPAQSSGGDLWWLHTF